MPESPAIGSGTKVPHQTGWSGKKACKISSYALVSILIIGSVIAGALGLNHVSCFGAIGSLGSKGLLFGGSGLFVSALVMFTINHYRSKKRSSLPSQIPSTPPSPPPQVYSTPSSPQIPSTSSTSAPRGNNLPPKIAPSSLNSIPTDLVTELNKVAPASTSHMQTLKEFQEASRTLFQTTCTEYLAGDSSKTFIQALFTERAEALAQVQRHHNTPLEITIVGAGPAGSVAALEAFLAGANVHLIEKRPAYSRDRMLRLSIDRARYLESRLGHLYTIADAQEILSNRRQGPFEREFFGSGNFLTVETHDLEWILNILLQELAKNDNGLNIHREWEFTSCSGNQVHLSHNSQQISFKTDWLIGADGMSSPVRTWAQMGWTARSTPTASAVVTFNNLWGNNVAYQHLDSFAPQAITDGFEHSKKTPHHVLAAKLIKRAIRPHIDAIRWQASGSEYYSEFRQPYNNLKGGGEPLLLAGIELAQLGGEQLQHDLQTQHGWELVRLPSNRLFTSTHTIYLGTDVPAHLLNNPGQLQTWLAETLEQNLPKEAIALLMTQIRTHHVFMAQLFRAQEVVQNRNGVKIFLIGDATATPHFQTGSGADKALVDAIEIGGCVRDWGRGSKADLPKKYEHGAKARITAMQEKAFKMGFAVPNDSKSVKE